MRYARTLLEWADDDDVLMEWLDTPQSVMATSMGFSEIE